MQISDRPLVELEFKYNGDLLNIPDKKDDVYKNFQKLIENKTLSVYFGEEDVEDLEAALKEFMEYLKVEIYGITYNKKEYIEVHISMKDAIPFDAPLFKFLFKKDKNVLIDDALDVEKIKFNVLNNLSIKPLSIKYKISNPKEFRLNTK